MADPWMKSVFDGPVGPTGPAGAAGAAGATGATGPTGPTGAANASGTGGTIGKFTGAGASTTVGDSSITDDATTVAIGVKTTVRGSLLVNNDGIGTTKTAGIYSINGTASGSQVSAQTGGSAKHSGGTVHNFGGQCEPQSAVRAIWRLCYGTGDPVSTPPSSTGWTLDTSDPTYGVCLSCSAFQSTGGTGFRMSVGGGGVKENGGTGQVNFYGASTSIGTLLESALAVGDSDPNWEFSASAGTRSAGDFITVRDGAGTWFSLSSTTATKGMPTFYAPIKMKSYTVAGVPTASSYTDAAIIVSNEAGGRTIATSDGTNWRRVSDGAIIS